MFQPGISVRNSLDDVRGSFRSTPLYVKVVKSGFSRPSLNAIVLMFLATLPASGCVHQLLLVTGQRNGFANFELGTVESTSRKNMSYVMTPLFTYFSEGS
jgi:hypothetical protein